MKALIYRKFGRADTLEWLNDWPDPVVAAEGVVVKTIAGSINPKDVLLRKGKFRRTFAREPLPRVSGMDMAGEVIAIGPDVSGFSVGDKVFGMTNKFCGGVHAEFANFHQSEICHSPSNISLVESACVPLAAQTALQALRACGGIKNGHKVLINGAGGGVGHFAVQIAKVLGAEVHAVCGPGNVQFVESLGADDVYCYTNQPATEIAHSFDLIFDVFGSFTRSEFAGQLGKRGIYVSTVPKPATLWAEVLARLGVSRTSRLVQVRSQTEDLSCIRAWIESGLVVPHLERTYPVGRAAEAHRHVESKHTVGKVCVVFQT
jgi:NADPH:quinone reductase-like Zn-dependent oxidoreductase